MGVFYICSLLKLILNYILNRDEQQLQKLNCTSPLHPIFTLEYKQVMNNIFSDQDRKTSGQTRGTGPPVAACSRSCRLHIRTPSRSLTTLSTQRKGSQSLATATCQCTARYTATPLAPSTLTTTPRLWIGTGQVSITEPF